MTLRSAQKSAIRHELISEVRLLIEGGEVAPVIHAVLPFDQVVEAHRLMESSAHIGKIVLKMG